MSRSQMDVVLRLLSTTSQVPHDPFQQDIGIRILFDLLILG
jgi:hypothetical protein